MEQTSLSFTNVSQGTGTGHGGGYPGATDRLIDRWQPVCSLHTDVLFFAHPQLDIALSFAHHLPVAGEIIPL